MNVLLFNATRKHMSGPCYPQGQVFHRLTSSVADAEWIVRIYYAASVYLAARLLYSVNDTVWVTASWDFLWPLAWVDGLDIGRTLSLLAVGCFMSSLTAFQFHRSVAARAIFSLLFLFVATVPNSLGGINHPYHAWFWVSFVFIFLPAGDAKGLDRAGQLSYLTVIRGAQALILLFYTMTGGFKLLFGLIAIATWQVGNFSPEALPLILANRILQTGTEPLLADFIINHPLLAWPMFLTLIYIQVVSVAIAFRPRLHVLWGYLQIGFHLGTWLLMQIIFAEHVLLLLILLVLSPQRAAFRSLFEALGDLPIVGLAFRRGLVPAEQPSLARTTSK